MGTAAKEEQAGRRLAVRPDEVGMGMSAGKKQSPLCGKELKDFSRLVIAALTITSRRPPDYSPEHRSVSMAS